MKLLSLLPFAVLLLQAGGVNRLHNLNRQEVSRAQSRLPVRITALSAPASWWSPSWFRIRLGISRVVPIGTTQSG